MQMLAIHSPVFRTMLYGAASQMIEAQTHTVRLDNISVAEAELFHQALLGLTNRFRLLNSLQLPSLRFLIQFCHQYQIQSLNEDLCDCFSKLVKSPTIDDFIFADTF